MTRTLIALTLATSLTRAADWPQYRGPNGDGSTPDKISAQWPSGGPKVLWKTDSSLGFSSFAVEGGLIYVGGGGAGQSLLALDPKTGAVVAKAFDEKITHATPVAGTILGQRQIVFFLQSGLLAVEPKTLKELWRYAFDYKTSTAASPVVDGDVVYCSAGYGVGGGAVRITKEGAGWKATEIYRLRGNKPLANHW